MHDKTNCDIGNLLNYLNMCKLKVNVTKTKYMIIGSAIESRKQIVINSELIEKVNSIKYLGIMIDSSLNFKDHLSFVQKKVSKKVYFIGRMRNKLCVEEKKLLYKSLVVPHIDYSSAILFMCNQSEIIGLQKLQNKAMRMILKED